MWHFKKLSICYILDNTSAIGKNIISNLDILICQAMGQTSSSATTSSTRRPSNTSTSSPNNPIYPSAANGGASTSSSLPNASSIADSAGSQLRENLEALHNQLMQHAGADYDIATTTTLSYTQFLSYITKLNEM